VIRGGQAPVIAKLPRAWKDRAYKKARRRGQAIAALTPAAAAAQAEPVTGMATADFEPETAMARNGRHGNGHHGNGHPGRQPDVEAYPWSDRA
jgi:hypothetical protein